MPEYQVQIQFRDGRRFGSTLLCPKLDVPRGFVCPSKRVKTEAVRQIFEAADREIGCENGKTLPDGSYTAHVWSDEFVLAVSNIYRVPTPGPLAIQIERIDSLPAVSEPTIPLALRAIGCAFSRSIYKSEFEPAYLDVQNAYIRAADLRSRNGWAKWLSEAAFCVRATHIVAVCLVRDWLAMTWPRAVKLLILPSLAAIGYAIMKWLFS